MNLPPLDGDLDPAEVIAVLSRRIAPERAARLDAAARGRMNGVSIVIEDLLDPHNYGAVLRSVEAMGLGHVYTINARHRFRVSAKVTQGSERWLEVHRFGSAAECAPAVRGANYKLLCAVPGASLRLDEIDPRERVALAFGNEHVGLSPQLRALADGEFCIPMHGLSQSLNVSVAVAIALHAATAARRKALGRDSDLDEAEQLMLRARFYAADVREYRSWITRFRDSVRT